MDLHGLHVSECQKVLRILLTEAVKTNRSSFSIITGLGQHSCGKAKLKPALKRYVKQTLRGMASADRLNNSDATCFDASPGVLGVRFK